MEDTTVLFQRAKAGEEAARRVLIEKNLGLVRHVQKRFLGRGTEEEDLFQIGVIGLIKAIDGFDLSYGTQFSTYAVPVIMGELRQHFRDHGPIKISRTILENASKVEKAREELRQRIGYDPRLSELEEATGLRREDVLMALEAGEGVLSLDSEAVREVPFLGGLEDEKERALERLLVKQIFDGLKPEEQKLLWLRFYREKTQTEIASLLGVSQVQVSRLEKKILLKLRTQVSKDYLF